jgi:hypothetical protein
MASKASRSKGSAKKGKRRANPIDDALARLERDIPRLLRQLRTHVKDMQKQVDRARADGEKRWRMAEDKIKEDAARVRERLETTIDRVRGRVKTASRKPGRKPAKAGGAKARATRKSTTSRKTSRKRKA